MREAFNFIRNYLLNGMHAYALFGIYALTISPFVTRFIDFGQRSTFVAIFGFVMLIAEFFALNFKLKMIKMRSEQKRIAYKKETGKDIIPSVGIGVFFGFCMRLVFHAAIIMVSMTALGYPCTERLMSIQGQIVLVVWIFADILAFGYMFVNTGFYTDTPQNRKELIEDLKEDEDWDKANSKLATDVKYFRREIIADIVLQIYTLMLFTCFWKYINDIGIDMLRDSLKAGENPIEAAFRLFPMLFVMIILGLMPMRIAYWIEDSMEAFSKRDKLGMRIVFVIVAIFSCSPAIIKFISLFILRQLDHPDTSSGGYLGYVLSFVLFMILLIMQILLFGKKETIANKNEQVV